MLQESIIKAICKNVKSKNHLYKHFNFYFHSQRYNLHSILQSIFIILKTGLPWRYLSDLHIEPKWGTVYKVYCKLIKFDIITSTYRDLLTKYFVRQKKSLKYRFTDTTTIIAKNGGEKVSYNPYYGRNKCSKISIITDNNGITYSAILENSKKNDSKILYDQLDIPYLVDLPVNNAYFLADKGYDSKKIKDKLDNMGYWPIIAVNKRNCKKDQPKMNKIDKKIYKKRIRVEHVFMKLKRFRRISIRYDRHEPLFMGFLFLGLMHLIK